MLFHAYSSLVFGTFLYQGFGEASRSLLNIMIQFAALAFAIIGVFVLVSAMREGNEDSAMARLAKVAIFIGIIAFIVLDFSGGTEGSIIVAFIDWFIGIITGGLGIGGVSDETAMLISTLLGAT